MTKVVKKRKSNSLLKFESLSKDAVALNYRNKDFFYKIMKDSKELKYSLMRTLEVNIATFNMYKRVCKIEKANFDEKNILDWLSYLNYATKQKEELGKCIDSLQELLFRLNKNKDAYDKAITSELSKLEIRLKREIV